MIVNLLQRIYQDSLFLNSLYLMFATAIVAGFGFFFWLINAQLFSTEDIGHATALISVMNLISILSLIGINATFIRFLPSSERPNDKLNTGLLLVGSTAVLLTGAFVALSSVISPPLHALLNTPATAFIFIFLCTLAAVNAITDSIFLAHRQTKYVLTINFVYSFCKMLLPFLFISYGAYGIFVAAAAAQGIGLALSIGILMRKFNYRPRLVIHRDILELVWRYSATNYLASVLNLLPVTLLPIIIINQLGAHEAAYYYIVMMIGNLLYTIPWATSRSLFAEGSNDEALLDSHFKKAVIANAALLTPSILFLVVAGGYVLQVFGADFASEGITFLRLVAISGVVVSATAIFTSFFQVKKKLVAIIITNTALAISTIALSFLLLPLGLLGIGIAWFVGNSTAALVGYILYRWPKNFYEKLGELVFFKLSILWGKWLCWKTQWNYGERKVVLCYPEKPKPLHMLYLILHRLGYTITSNPAVKHDLVVAFEDTTFRSNLPVLSALREKEKVINADCGDISKKRVDAIFTEVFGYSSFVDPLTYPGKYVRKSNMNTAHDGALMEGPTTPTEGYIYQRLIHSPYGEDMCRDMRIMIVGNSMPIVFYRYRDLHDRFSGVRLAEWVNVNDVLSADEQEHILLFCKKFGLDYGELDAVRDGEDGKIYIIDANNTPSGPVPFLHIKKTEYNRLLSILSESVLRKLVEHANK